MATKKTPPNRERGQFEIEINGQKVQGWTTTNALRLYTEAKECTLEEIEEKMQKDQLGSLADLAYYSCVNHSHRTGEHFEMTRDAFVSFFLDDLEQMTDIAETVLKSMHPQGLKNEAAKKQ